MRKGLQDLYNKVAGQTVFVIGGGPSFNLIDRSLLENKIIISINNAYKEFPDATMLYWCDESWIGTHYDNIMNHPCKLRFTAKHSADGYISKDLKATGNATVLKRTGDYGIDCDVNHVIGNNSGAQVLNLLANMRVNKIALLGYDMNVKTGKTHWHEGHGLAITSHIYSDLFLPSIESMSPGLKHLGIDVVNCSHNSSIKCFRKQSFNDFVKENFKEVSK